MPIFNSDLRLTEKLRMAADVDEYENQDLVENFVHEQEITFNMAFAIPSHISGQLMVSI